MAAGIRRWISLNFLSFIHRCWDEEQRNKKPSLNRVLLKTFRREFLLLLVVTLFNDFVVRLVNPLLLHTVIRYFR